jgi:hypothetical protein
MRQGPAGRGLPGELSVQGDTDSEETADDCDPGERSGSCRLASLSEVVSEVGQEAGS